MLDAHSPSGENRPRIFLSSTYKETPFGEVGIRYFWLRQELAQLGEDLKLPIWVHEFHGQLTKSADAPLELPKPGDKPNWITSVRECLDELSRSDLLIVLLARRAGERVAMDELGETAASIFEVELFYASQWRIPVVFYVVRGFEPEPELSNLIEMLHLKDGNRNWIEIDENEIIGRVRELLKSFYSINAKQWTLRYFHDNISDRRSFGGVRHDIYSNGLSFIDRFAPRNKDDFSRTRFDKLLEISKETTQQKAGQLGFLWMALRELSTSGWCPDRSDEWLRLSNRWPSTAAWTGLHGALYFSALAAFHTRNDILLRDGRSPEDDPKFPFGPMASELYSTGLRCETPQWKKRRFEAAVKLASRHADRSPKSSDGALAIRASAYLRLAQLGRPWHAYNALSDYRNAYRLRERNSASPSAVGEALSEWAFAEFYVRHLMHFRTEAALKKMREGVRLMDSDPDPNRVGFLVRGKRKLADALRQVDHHDEADRELKSAEALARKHGILGQVNCQREA